MNKFFDFYKTQVQLLWKWKGGPVDAAAATETVVEPEAVAASVVVGEAS